MSWKTPITMLVLTVVLLCAAFYGWKTIISPATEDDDSPTSTKPTCEQTQDFRQGQVIKSTDIVVNVYNAGSIANLASDTLATLDNKGFEPGVADNAPANASAKGSPPVKLVAQQFKGTVKFAKGGALAAGIDVIVGDDFEGLEPGAPRQIRVTRDTTTCSDVETAAS